jgi:hypothetical protein
LKVIYSTNPAFPATQFISEVTTAEATALAKRLNTSPKLSFLNQAPVIGPAALEIEKAGATTVYGIAAFGGGVTNSAAQFLDVASMQAPLTGTLSISERARQAKASVQSSAIQVGGILALGAATDIIAAGTVLKLPFGAGQISGKALVTGGFAGYEAVSVQPTAATVYNMKGEEVASPYGGWFAGATAGLGVLALSYPPVKYASKTYAGEFDTTVNVKALTTNSGKVIASYTHVTPNGPTIEPTNELYIPSSRPLFVPYERPPLFEPAEFIPVQTKIKYPRGGRNCPSFRFP